MIRLILFLSLACAATNVTAAGFLSAKPVWPRGKELELNGSYSFRGTFCAKPDQEFVLKVAAAYPYRVMVNGAFAGYGPTRAAPGFFRMDEWTVRATNGVNALEIEAYSGGCGNFHFPKQKAFLQAELLSNGKTVLASGDNLAAYETQRVRKAPRYSLQRMFTEVRRFPAKESPEKLDLAIQSEKTLLPRGYAYPSFSVDRSFRAISREKVGTDPKAFVRDMQIIVNKRPDAGVYPENELEANPFYELQRIKTIERHAVEESGPHDLSDGEGITFCGSVNRAGFVGLTVECAEPCKVYLTYDELLQSDGSVDFMRGCCNNSIELIFERGGRYDFEAFAANAFRHVRVLAMGGKARISTPYVRSYQSPAVERARFDSSDPTLQRIFEAAKLTLAENAVDCLTDCPTRERAGWCGDTFFTGKACSYLTGSGEIEKLFLSNWLMVERFECPADKVGLLPAVFPVDLRYSRGSFIPNFSLWFVLELEDYAERTGDRAFVESFREKVIGVFDFLAKFENADGLLEKLPGWVFVEWSEANNLVQDVNYPSNMQYAMALDAAARLYGEGEFSRKAEKVREAIRRQSWTGRWFCDNSIRQTDGTLLLSGKCTETCQYFSFFSGVADRTRDKALWDRLLSDERKELYPPNFIFGRCLRMELLSAAGERRRLYEEMLKHFLPMAEKTGTLWEHDRPTASCCHGIASIAAVYLLRDILGVRRIDPVRKLIEFRPESDLPLEFCEATVPVSPAACATLGWRRRSGGIDVSHHLPKDWQISE